MELRSPTKKQPMGRPPERYQTASRESQIQIIKNELAEAYSSSNEYIRTDKEEEEEWNDKNGV